MKNHHRLKNGLLKTRIKRLDWKWSIFNWSREGERALSVEPCREHRTSRHFHYPADNYSWAGISPCKYGSQVVNWTGWEKTKKFLSLPLNNWLVKLSIGLDISEYVYQSNLKEKYFKFCKWNLFMVWIKIVFDSEKKWWKRFVDVRGIERGTVCVPRTVNCALHLVDTKIMAPKLWWNRSGIESSLTRWTNFEAIRR